MNKDKGSVFVEYTIVAMVYMIHIYYRYIILVCCELYYIIKQLYLLSIKVFIELIMLSQVINELNFRTESRVCTSITILLHGLIVMQSKKPDILLIGGEHSL